MARGYHDWLVAETAGALKTCSANITSPVTLGLGVSPICSLENLASAGVLLRIQRVLLFPTFVTTTFNALRTQVIVQRVTGPTGGTTPSIINHDTLDAASGAELRRSPTSITSSLATMLSWFVWWFVQTTAAADVAAMLSPPLDLYTHFSDGRRQPWTLRPGEALHIQVLPSIVNVIGFGSTIEFTEEPLG